MKIITSTFQLTQGMYKSCGAESTLFTQLICTVINENAIVTFYLDQAGGPGPPSELLQARTDDIEMPDTREARSRPAPTGAGRSRGQGNL
jgi:hypothetical protein